MSKATVAKSKKSETYKVSFDLTRGELISLHNALGLWGTKSSVAADLKSFLDNALIREGSPECVEISEEDTPTGLGG